MKLKPYEPKHVPEVHRVIDLTADPPTEKVVVNLTDAPFAVEQPYWEDGPATQLLLTPPDGRADMLPEFGRTRHAGKHAKQRLAVIRQRIRSAFRKPL